MDEETSQLCTKIKEDIATIDDFATAIAVNETEKKDLLYRLFVLQIQEVFPMIMNYYLREDMKGSESELKEWSGQLSRIMDALKGKDLFFLFDVLEFETKENMLYLYRTIA